MKKSYYAIFILLISTLFAGCGKQKADEEAIVTTIEKEMISQTADSVTNSTETSEPQNQEDEEELPQVEMEQITDEQAEALVITPIEPSANSPANEQNEEQQNISETEQSGEAVSVHPQGPTETPAIKPVESPTQEPATDPTEPPTQEQPQEPVEQPTVEPGEESDEEQDITIELPFVPVG